LTDLQRKNIKEDLSNATEQQLANAKAAANKLIEAISTTPILKLPDFAREFVLFTDASDRGLGAALLQGYGGRLHPVCLWSRKLSDTEMRYSATEREALAIVYFLRKFRHYLLERRFVLLSDHRALKYVFAHASENSKLARWALQIQEFAFDVAYVPGPENIIADWLSRMDFGQGVKELNISHTGA
jgi:hypothetical protein